MPAQRPPGRFTIVGLSLVIALLLVLPVGVAADPTPIAVGASIQFVGNGFSPNEPLAFWETGSDGTSNPLPVEQQADGNGGFSIPVTFPSAGTWQVTAYGTLSNHQASSSYAVGATASTTASSATSSTTSGVLPAGT